MYSTIRHLLWLFLYMEFEYKFYVLFFMFYHSKKIWYVKILTKGYKIEWNLNLIKICIYYNNYI